MFKIFALTIDARAMEALGEVENAHHCVFSNAARIANTTRSRNRDAPFPNITAHQVACAGWGLVEPF